MQFITTEAFNDIENITMQNVTFKFDLNDWLDAVDPELGSDFELTPLYDEQGFFYSYVM